MIRKLRAVLGRTLVDERFAPVAIAMVGLGLTLLSGAYQQRRIEYDDLGEAIETRRTQLQQLEGQLATAVEAEAVAAVAEAKA